MGERGHFLRHRLCRDPGRQRSGSDDHDLRARRPAVRLREARPGAGDQERRAARHALRRHHVSGRQLQRARADECVLRSVVQHQRLGLCLLHAQGGHGAVQPCRPFHREWRCRERRRDGDFRHQPPGQRGQPQRRRAALRQGWEALCVDRRERQWRQRAGHRQPARQAAAHQQGRHHPQRQSQLWQLQRQQPGDRCAGSAQCVHARGAARQRPALRQRCRRGLGGDQPLRYRLGAGRAELRLEQHRRISRLADRACRLPRPGVCLRPWRYRPGYRAVRRRFLQPSQSGE